MNTIGLKKEIVDLINVLKERFYDFEKQEHIPKTELENVLNSVENFYKKVVILNYLNTIGVTTNENQSNAQLIENASVTTPTQNNILKDESEKIVEKHFSNIENQEKPEQQSLTVEVSVIDDLTEDLLTSIIDKSNVIPEITEDKKLSNSPKTTLVDLKSGIGINDKFQYISELFEGSGEKYEEAIQQLNTCETLEPSLLYLEDIQKLYHWKENSAIVKRLSDLVKSRFL